MILNENHYKLKVSNEERYIFDDEKYRSFNEKMSKEEFDRVFAFSGKKVQMFVLEKLPEQKSIFSSVFNLNEALERKMKDDISKDPLFIFQMQVFKDLISDIQRKMQDIEERFEKEYKKNNEKIIKPLQELQDRV